MIESNCPHVESDCLVGFSRLMDDLPFFQIKRLLDTAFNPTERFEFSRVATAAQTIRRKARKKTRRVRFCHFLQYRFGGSAIKVEMRCTRGVYGSRIRMYAGNELDRERVVSRLWLARCSREGIRIRRWWCGARVSRAPGIPRTSLGPIEYTDTLIYLCPRVIARCAHNTRREREREKQREEGSLVPAMPVGLFIPESELNQHRLRASGPEICNNLWPIRRRLSSNCLFWGFDQWLNPRTERFFPKTGRYPSSVQF